MESENQNNREKIVSCFYSHFRDQTNKAPNKNLDNRLKATGFYELVDDFVDNNSVELNITLNFILEASYNITKQFCIPTVSGALIGAASAAFTGGDIAEGTTYGTKYGALFGTIMSSLQLMTYAIGYKTLSNKPDKPVEINENRDYEKKCLESKIISEHILKSPTDYARLNVLYTLVKEGENQDEKQLFKKLLSPIYGALKFGAATLGFNMVSPVNADLNIAASVGAVSEVGKTAVTQVENLIKNRKFSKLIEKLKPYNKDEIDTICGMVIDKWYFSELTKEQKNDFIIRRASKNITDCFIDALKVK